MLLLRLRITKTFHFFGEFCMKSPPRVYNHDFTTWAAMLIYEFGQKIHMCIFVEQIRADNKVKGTELIMERVVPSGSDKGNDFAIIQTDIVIQKVSYGRMVVRCRNIGAAVFLLSSFFSAVLSGVFQTYISF